MFIKDLRSYQNETMSKKRRDNFDAKKSKLYDIGICKCSLPVISCQEAKCKDPDNCNVFALIQLLASSEKQEEIRKKYLAWGYGYGHAKLELLDIFLDYFKDARYKYDLLQKDDAEVYKRIQNWNNIASEIAKNKYLEMEKIVWLI